MQAFAALADETRREIVVLVAKNGEMSSTAISQKFKMSAPAISQHLKVLREASVLHVKKDAQKRLYSVNRSGMEAMEKWFYDIKAWNLRFDRLDLYMQKLKKERANVNE